MHTYFSKAIMATVVWSYLAEPAFSGSSAVNPQQIRVADSTVLHLVCHHGFALQGGIICNQEC